MKHNALLVLAIAASSFVVPAVQADEEQELAALMSLLDEETAVATKTRMNADYVPGSVSVLHGDELRKFGFHTLGEALDMVAGVLVSQNNQGGSVTTVRGIGGNLGSSNIKILLDGVPLNNVTNGTADAVLNIPLSQLERMEVIRGPGSSLYGEFAFTGVVNFITRKQATVVGALAGSHQYQQYDAFVASGKQQNIKWNINLSQWQQEDSGRSTGKDDFYYQGVGNSPGEVFDNNRGFAMTSNLDVNGYGLLLQFIDYERGAEFGSTAALADDLAPRSETVLALTGRKEWELNERVRFNLSLGLQQSDQETALTLPVPAGIDPPGPAPLLVDDIHRRDGFSDRSTRIDAQLYWQAHSDHEVLFGVGYEHLEVTDAFAYQLIVGDPIREFSDQQTRVQDGAQREVINATLQDQWRLTPDLDLTLGARYDAYDDAGTNISPRLAAVWRPAEQHIVKAQYAEAFRPPTLEEFYPGPLSYPGGVVSELEAERLRSSELSYIYRIPSLTLRMTLFNMKVTDLIEFVLQPGRVPAWRNRGEVVSNGVEWEWQQNIGRSWNILANFSFADAQDKLQEDRLVGSVQWQGNLGATWNQSAIQSHSLRIRYVGAQQGWNSVGTIERVSLYDPHTTVNYHWEWTQALGFAGLKFQGGINNLLDEHYEVAPYPNLYPNGLEQDGRTYWFGIGYDFGASPN